MKKILIVLLCFILMGCGYDEYDMPDDVILTNNENKYKVFDELKIKDLIKETNVEIINEDETIVTGLVGDRLATIEYNYHGRKYKYDMIYHISDDIEPLVLSYTKTITIKKGDDVYPCSKINYIDNYDRHPSCTIEGDYDTTKIGSYTLKYVITDSSNNTVEKGLTLKVLKEYPKDNSKPETPKETPKDEIEDMIQKYKTTDNEIGIDVSRWQGDIDYEAVKNAGVSFVIMRMGVHNGPDETLTMDSKFQQNIENAKKAGLKVGVYVYTTALSQDEAIDHAKWVIKELKKATLDFPIAFDWENWSYIKDYEVSMHDMQEIYKAFAKEITKNDYEAMLYGSKYYLENIWGDISDKVWLAHYTEQTSYAGKYQLWQLSNIGKVPGIKGDVDLDIYYPNK